MINSYIAALFVFCVVMTVCMALQK